MDSDRARRSIEVARVIETARAVVSRVAVIGAAKIAAAPSARRRCLESPIAFNLISGWRLHERPSTFQRRRFHHRRKCPNSASLRLVGAKRMFRSNCQTRFLASRDFGQPRLRTRLWRRLRVRVSEKRVN